MALYISLGGSVVRNRPNFIHGKSGVEVTKKGMAN
jgi:hypothetical protein